MHKMYCPRNWIRYATRFDPHQAFTQFKYLETLSYIEMQATGAVETTRHFGEIHRK